ncbi:MAG: serine/threonine-protein kinase [Pirellulaceae bacterium]|nr:serine/threonine-protein kinase [Pirellulaceae bacterium]
MTREQPLAWRTLSRSQQAEIEDCVAKFEQQWHLRNYPKIDDFLPKDAQLVDVVRSELEAIDGEFRQRLGVDSHEASSHLNAASVLNATSEQVHDDEPTVKRAVKPIQLTSIYETPYQEYSGGLGDVWVVHEPSLGRSVAIKQLQHRWRHHARARHTFLQEVRITSLLEHPGVAPVHAVGETEDGRPCYSMRYIHGETFEQAIAGYHAGGDRPVAKLRELLGHFVTVCNTIAYAHSREVLHRDLKPANIMIGSFGQTMVIDWGLAKQFNCLTDPITNQSSVAEMLACDSLYTDTRVSESEATKLDAEFDRLQTALGDIVGTPAFMSPEQARGKIDQISTRTDVFGLGAVLFNILYGKPPYADHETDETLQRAADGTCVYPNSQVIGSVPKALAAICAKAMAHQSQNRYESPTLLAIDIQNWLVGEPISAMREPLSERLVRFAQKRRTLAASIVFLLVALGATALAASVVLHRERTEKLLAERTAEIKAQSAKNVTEYLSKVFRTVDPVQFDDTGFTGSENLDTRQTFRKVLDSGAELVDLHLKDQPESYGEILASLGTSYRGLGEYELAEQILQKSLNIRRERFGEGSFEALKSTYLMARCAQESGDYKVAIQRFREVITSAQRLHPPAPLLIADAKYNLAWTLYFQPFMVDRPSAESVAESIDLFSEVVVIREQHLGPKDRGVGLAHAGLASARMLAGQRKLAELSVALAMEIFNLSDQESALGNFLVTYRKAENARNDGKAAEAEAIYKMLKDTISKHLGKQHPIYIFHLWNMAGHYRKFDQLTQAEAAIDEVRSAIKPLGSLRSTPVHLDGLCQYAEQLVNVNLPKAQEVAEEIICYANERPDINQAFLDRAKSIQQQAGMVAQKSVESKP